MQLTDQYVLWYLARIFFHFYGKCAEFPSQYSNILQSAVCVCEGHWILLFYLVFLFDYSLLTHTPYVILVFFLLVMTCFPTCSACPHLLFFLPRMYISTRWILTTNANFPNLWLFQPHDSWPCTFPSVFGEHTNSLLSDVINVTFRKMPNEPAAYFMSGRFMYRLLT